MKSKKKNLVFKEANLYVLTNCHETTLGDKERKVRMFIDNNNGMDMDDEQELESGVQLTRSDGLMRRGVCLNSVR